MSPTPFSFQDLSPVPRSSMVSPYVNSLARLQIRHGSSSNPLARATRCCILSKDHHHLLLVQDFFVLLVGLDLDRLQLNHRCEGGCGLLLLLSNDTWESQHY